MPKIQPPPITRNDFLQYARPMKGHVDGLLFELQPDESAQRSLLWRYHAIRPWELDLPRPTDLLCSITFTITVLGSNKLPD